MKTLSPVGSGYDTFVLPSLLGRHNKTIQFFRVVYFNFFPRLFSCVKNPI